jgi:hypothetical protein
MLEEIKYRIRRNDRGVTRYNAVGIFTFGLETRRKRSSGIGLWAFILNLLDIIIHRVL